MHRFLFHPHACLSLVGVLIIGLIGCSNEDTSDASNQPNSAKSSVSAESSGASSSEKETHAEQGSDHLTGLHTQSVCQLGHGDRSCDLDATLDRLGLWAGLFGTR